MYYEMHYINIANYGYNEQITNVFCSPKIRYNQIYCIVLLLIDTCNPHMVIVEGIDQSIF